MSDHASGNIKVVVRCRPLNKREIERGSKGLVSMSGVQTTLHPPESSGPLSSRAVEKAARTFAFDKSYWSVGAKDDPAYASQQTLYHDLGEELLQHCFEGFNCCIFAYGQTGSGKSYSMMGYGPDKGIIPLTCSALFEDIETRTTELQRYTVEVSFYEIYNEKIRDLLNPKSKGNLRVREHPSTGPYVEDLAKLAVESYADIERLMDEGNKARTVAATNMNETSSRSHSVFTVLVTQKKKDPDTGMEGEKVSRINLVDLAGSERANASGATGSRLKEGANINRSLTTLGKVIAALAQASTATTPKGRKAKEDFIPYRDSSLTWLLKDSIGGNSKTCMIAAISPADYEETMSTLRYADQAKKIKNRAVVNEDPNAKLIRELKEELQNLRSRVAGGGEATFDPDIPPEKQVVQYQTKAGEIKSVSKAELVDQIEQGEKLMKEVNQTWEEKLQKTQEIQKARESALEELGITIEKNLVGVHTPRKMPHLVNLNEDPLASECLLFCIKRGTTTVGNSESTVQSDIRLTGPAIKDEHCFFEHGDADNSSDKSVYIAAIEGAMTLVNGRQLSPGVRQPLKSGDRVIMGNFHIFRFNNPEEVRQARAKSSLMQEVLRSPYQNNDNMTPPTRPDSPFSSNAEAADWAYARREAVLARLNGSDGDLDKLNDDDLDKLYSDILRARTNRKGTSILESTDENEDGEDTERDDVSTTASPRPFSGSTWTTDNTSLDSTLVPNGHSAIDADAKAKIAKDELDLRLEAQKSEYEEKLREMAKPKEETDNDELQKQLQFVRKDLQKKLEGQKRKYEKKVKKLAEHNGLSASLSDDEEQITFSQRELQLLNFSLERWRRCTAVHMSEHLLSLAVLVKEANVISKELRKCVTYQFTIVGPVSFSGVCSSAVEGILGLNDELVDAGLAKAAARPCLAIKVLDYRHSSAYLWSIETLKERLTTMRNLYNFIDNPSYSEHLNWEDPFYTTPPPSFSHIGFALIPLSPISQLKSIECQTPIYSTFSETTLGHCRIRVRRIKAISDQERTPTQVSHDESAALRQNHEDDRLANASKLSFELLVDKLQGLSLTDISAIHCQFKSSSLSGSSTSFDQTYLSEVVEIPQGKATPTKCALTTRHAITLEVTEDMRKHLQASYGSIEIFARVKDSYLRSIERLDFEDTVSAQERGHLLLNGDSELTKGRLAETEMITEQHHDVMASIEIQEMGADGKYSPVDLVAANPLDRGEFKLHQGLQRRIVLNLSHNSGKQWHCKEITSLSIGDVRLLDGRGIIHVSQNQESISLSTKANRMPCTYQSDGTAKLSFEVPWDSSSHDSLFLNRATPSGSRILLKFSWAVDAANCEKPVIFNTDVAVNIQSRDSRSSGRLIRFLSSSRTMKRADALFAVKLVPSMTRPTSELWRRDTSKSFVRGEDKLGDWCPRRVSLIRERISLARQARKLADVNATKAILDGREFSTSEAGANTDPEQYLRKALEIWQDNISPAKEEIVPSGMPAFEGSKPSKKEERRQHVEKKFVADVRMIPYSSNGQLRGYLEVLRDPASDHWKRRWFVLNRPYIYMFENSDELERVGVVNISTVKVDNNEELERMLERQHVFAAFTEQNAYFFQADSSQNLRKWLYAIDPSYSQ